jgi:hypothetical protein
VRDEDEDEECVAFCYSHPFFLQSFILFFLINKKRKKTKKILVLIFFFNFFNATWQKKNFKNKRNSTWR